MAYVVTRRCIGRKDRSCVEVCPVDCFYDIKKKEYNDKYSIALAHDGTDAGMLVIHPDECIHCGACATECPVEAIYEDSDVPSDLEEFVKINEQETSALSDKQLDEVRCTSKG